MGVSIGTRLKRFLPRDQGTYPCFNMCLIWRFMVRKKRAMKYKRRMGQKTGMSKTLKKVIKNAVTTARALAHQNLNSGRRRLKGLVVEERVLQTDDEREQHR